MALWHFPMTGTYQIIFPEICKMLEVLLGEKYIYNIAIYRLVIDCSSGPIPIYEIKIDIWFIYIVFKWLDMPITVPLSWSILN